MPLYAEKITSPVSTQLVEEHLEGCADCRAELAQMQAPVPVKIEQEPAAPLQEIKKGIRRKQKNTILAVAGIILLLAAAFFLTSCEALSSSQPSAASDTTVAVPCTATAGNSKKGA